MVAAACKARVRGARAFLTDSLPPPPFPCQSWSPGSPGVKPAGLCFPVLRVRVWGLGRTVGSLTEAEKLGGPVGVRAPPLRPALVLVPRFPPQGRTRTRPEASPAALATGLPPVSCYK